MQQRKIPRPKVVLAKPLLRSNTFQIKITTKLLSDIQQNGNMAFIHVINTNTNKPIKVAIFGELLTTTKSLKQGDLCSMFINVKATKYEVIYKLTSIRLLKS